MAYESLYSWMSALVIKPAYDPDGKIIGIELHCLVTHDKLAYLPDALIPHVHDVLDQALAAKAGKNE